MRNLFLLLVILPFLTFAKGVVKKPYAQEFEQAYQACPSLPPGLLEAVAYSNTRMIHIQHDSTTPESCIGLPKAYGVMGLTLDGKGYFRNNLQLISQLSGIPQSDLMASPAASIMGYAKAYAELQDQFNLKSTSIENQTEILVTLSELPQLDLHTDFALSAQLYGILSFLNNQDHQLNYHFQSPVIDLEAVFGAGNLAILSASHVTIAENTISTPSGLQYKTAGFGALPLSADYAAALWNPTTCNYSSRSGTAITAVTIHTVQGSYSGCISWFKNCSANASAHYVLRSSDGQVTQMILESNKAWHVGSENPYTIGLEHEGYIDNAAWYTNAMYQSSAAVCKDICNSGYGINPLRTYFGPGCSGTTGECQQGSCVKIKGHQMYPNQSHTDPGPNWNWDYFYKLINDNPTITTLPTSVGNLYDSGGAGANYADDERKLTLITVNGASSVTLTFSAFNLETNYDYLFIYDGNSVMSPLIGKYTGTNSPGTVTSSGSSLLVEFRSDCATTASGYAASWSSVTNPTPPVDTIPPVTTLTLPSSWVTQNFSAGFTDTDNAGGSGVEKNYYQVVDYNGYNWLSNAGRGFLNDDFSDSIQSYWTNYSGNWAIANGALVQSDENNGNSNISAALAQNLSNRYLYHWTGMIEGSGTNRRAGFHYFCSDDSLPNHGNSYFVWFRIESAKLQFYKVVNDTFSLEKDVPLTLNGSQWYDFKVIYDRITGTSSVYVNNLFIESWTDPSPYANGDYIAFRSGNSVWKVNDLRVYRSRFNNATITIGDSLSDLRYQNPSPTSPAGLIRSVTLDSAKNISAIASAFINVDWSPAAMVPFVKDGIGNDLDTTMLSNELSANWGATLDAHSGVSRYFYAVGTSPGDSSVVGWTDNWNAVQTTDTGLSLQYNQMYYYQVKTINGAGIYSSASISDGILVVAPEPPPTADFTFNTTTICDVQPVQFTNLSVDASSYEWIFEGGSPASSNSANPSVVYANSGTYQVTLIAVASNGTSDTIIQSLNVMASPSPNAIFIGNPTTVYLPNADVSFTNNSSGATSYLWDFGDGDTTSLNNPTHHYASAGSYTVSLIAANGTCPDNQKTLTNYITVANPPTASPVAGFINSSTDLCQGQTVSYTDTSLNATGYQWTFEGGSPNTSTLQNPVVAYTSGGSYLTTLIALGINGAADTVSQIINFTVVNPAQADFSANQTTVYLPNAQVQFVNNSVNADSYAWDFGDGTTGNQANPLHYYDSAGLYTVSLAASNNTCPNSSVVMQDFITVIAETVNLPAASFSTPDTLLCNGEPLEPTNTSMNAASYEWYAEGGSPAYSVNQNPSITYPSSGIYEITLVAHGSGGQTDTAVSVLNLVIGSAAQAAFTASQTTVYLPNATVNFNNLSSDANSYLWDFGDGNISLQTHPSYTYADTGTYLVKLIAENSDCGADTGFATIQVLPEPIDPPVASFSTSNTAICEGSPVQYTGNSSNTIAYEWIFENGSPGTSNSQNPGVTYAQSGNWTVTLIAHGTSNTSDTLTQTISITVNPPPIANFTAGSTTVYLPSATVNFINQSTNAIGYNWAFGDGATSGQTSPSHTYSNTGVYTVSLTASNSVCPSDTHTESAYIQVEPEPITPPTASFTNGSTTICSGDGIQFSSTSTLAISQNWTFENGSPATSNDQNPIVFFTASGSYQITLIANGANGTADTISQLIQVVAENTPNAQFAANQTTVTLPSATVNFINNSQNASSFVWLFGDGNQSVQQSPIYTYSTPGVYTVSLVAIGNTCPNDTITQTNYITVIQSTPAPPVAGFSLNSTTVCSGTPIQFTDTSTYANALAWTFTGGTPSYSTSPNPQVIYQGSGAYQVTLIATGPGGADTTSTIIQVDLKQPPIATFTTNTTNLTLPDATVFTSNTSGNSTDQTWDFGDGVYSIDHSPWHQYSDTGNYTIVLIAQNPPCPEDTAIVIVHVSPAVGINAPAAISSIVLYPNPTGGDLNLTMGTQTKTEYRIAITNTLGTIVHRQSLPSGKSSHLLRVAHLPAGAYEINLQNDTVIYQMQFLKVQ